MRRKFANRIPRPDLNQLLRFQMNPPQSIERLADRLGLFVIEAELEAGLDGYLDHDPRHGSRSGYVIYINRELNTPRKRWTLAHELGHYFLHKDEMEKTLELSVHRHRGKLDNLYDEDRELEANNFAEDLFFGNGALEAAVSLHGRNVQHLARRVFGVPEQSVEIALRFLDWKAGARGA